MQHNEDIGLFTEPSTLRRTTLSGVTEILLIVAIVVAVFLLPRMMAKNPDKDLKPSNPGFSIPGRMRLAIVLSFLWPALVALFLKPWNNHWVAFLYVALGPVALSWGIWWIWWGFRKERRRW
jgi:hypothetical protein